MNQPQPTWNAVLSVVPEAQSVPSATSEAVTQHVEHLPPPGFTDTPARLLTEVLSVAAGPARKDVREALATDAQRRALAVGTLGGSTRRTTRLVLIVVMFIAILAPMPGSSRYGGSGEPFLDVEPAVLVSGTLSVLALLGFIVLAARGPIPNARVWYLAYVLILGFDLVYSLFRIEDVSYDSYAPLAEQLRGPLVEEIIGAGLMLVAVVGFATLWLVTRRRPTAQEAAYSDSEGGRALDEQLLTDVREVIHQREDVHVDSLRAQAVDGVHALFDQGRVDVMQASSMLREVIDHYPVSPVQR